MGEQNLRPRILVVEDEWLIADYLREVLEEAGYVVCGPAARVSQALLLIEQDHPDAALLDINLRGETSIPVARVLSEKSVPFAFMTGYMRNDLGHDLKGRPVLNKPIDLSALIKCVAKLIGAPTTSREPLAAQGAGQDEGIESAGAHYH
jgi:DNA-binding response OmpR family regulator